MLPGDIPDNAALNSASLTHFPSGVCVCVCVCVGSGTQVYFKERRWWHLCHLRPLFSLWEMVPLITHSTDTVCRSGGIKILFFTMELGACEVFTLHYLYKALLKSCVLLYLLFPFTGPSSVTGVRLMMICLCSITKNTPNTITCTAAISCELTVDIEYIFSTAGP